MKINMSHGSGGKASAELMRNIFGKYFGNEVLDKMEDAAVLDLPGKIAYSTDSFVVTPVVFKGGDIGKLSVCGTVNDLLMLGAEPKYLTAGFILEEGLELDQLETIVASMAETAKKAGVVIVAGDTKVVEGRGGLFINTSGIGLIPEGRDVSAANCEQGDVILLSGTLGDHHACILSARMEIENNIASDCACLNDIPNTLFQHGIHVKTMRDVTRGGLATVLNEIADTSQCGVELREDDIPVHPEVMGFCDILGLDPLTMGNEGKMIVIVPEEDAEKALTLMKETAVGRDAVIIGKATAGKGVVMKTRIGGSRVVDVLYGEGLPRIC
ncbi:hydrogenase expression/formation protein HypE [Sinanaerobacter chloroacetimidivorans]|uniref:Hydrogenase expression/formation protein HypE n=1 Tax=Sinanaerobacter chloroacetimidivorans TaxID=2818044 RepID=A0A8J7W1Y1_9FIRM|nr:hydrogenase expression/formation protein HypE [Sinanaerobacter chloroacetimidivorans]MBR0597616.1 hydrogenase expression/formation protein HypE [Sinanaerobacter chloroacetimidivorans]